MTIIQPRLLPILCVLNLDRTYINVKNQKFILFLGLLIISSHCLAKDHTKINEESLNLALKKYLNEKGDFCLGKFDWPINVSEAEFNNGSRDSIQMPVLEKLGLVSVSDASALRKIDETDIPVPVKRYQLTDEGKKFYLEKESFSRLEGKAVQHSHDFCAAKVSLKKIANWQKAIEPTEGEQILVNYTYNLKTVPWAENPEIQKVFPYLAQLIKGAGQAKLQQQFKLVDGQWLPVYPWQQ